MNAVLPPVPCLLRCPECNGAHVDAPEPHDPECSWHSKAHGPTPCDCGAWTNPPHKTHLCNFCGHLWRPFPFATTGVLLARGWAPLWNARKDHFFDADGHSLCGKWLVLGTPQ